MTELKGIHTRRRRSFANRSSASSSAPIARTRSSASQRPPRIGKIVAWIGIAAGAVFGAHDGPRVGDEHRTGIGRGIGGEPA